MYRIAVLDDDERWCLALQRFSRNELEIFVFSYAEHLVENLVQQIEHTASSIYHQQLSSRDG